ncbi:flagellar protein FlgN [Sagittula salina]|uniref:Flagellar protein FlgN n=1 Tax=Sagittula salina TaxID=2820268 RepID=A0A940MQ16_9RHOB|nr:flagellar protein FlgN [Sagittula salina]MBP0483354.1 flagellar protein FlgN [Sagittula salina]
MDNQVIACKLAALVEAERAALLAGDFERISALIAEKQALVAELRDTPDAASILAPLREGLRRNQELFDQALAGIRNVAARLGDLRRTRKSTVTYDRQGRKLSIDAPEIRTLEKRA